MGEFYAGMVHPLTSVDHLLPILALAVIAGRMSRDVARWVIAAFPAALMVAIPLGNSYPGLSVIHIANLLAIVAMGTMALKTEWLTGKVVIATALGIGLILGYRSGIDMAASSVGYKFLPGVGLTGFISITLATAWIPAAPSKRIDMVMRLIAGAIVLAGVYLLVEAALGGGLQSVRFAVLPDEQSLVSWVKEPELSVPLVAATILAVLIWGAAHAITPGHGKAIVAAFLVGAKSTPWHAIYLGLIVTATHTLGVFALGLFAVVTTRYWATQAIYPWMEMASGLIVLGIGAVLFVRHIKTRVGHHSHDGAAEHDHHHDHHTQDHSHGHTHFPAGSDSGQLTWKSLLGLGIAGGLLPCPSALVLLLAAISIQRIAFGLVLVAAFSLGLAAVLTAVGLLFVRGKEILERTPRIMAASRMLPIFSSLLIGIIGAVIYVRALAAVV